MNKLSKYFLLLGASFLSFSQSFSFETEQTQQKNLYTCLDSNDIDLDQKQPFFIKSEIVNNYEIVVKEIEDAKTWQHLVQQANKYLSVLSLFQGKWDNTTKKRKDMYEENSLEIKNDNDFFDLKAYVLEKIKVIKDNTNLQNARKADEKLFLKEYSNRKHWKQGEVSPEDDVFIVHGGGLRYISQWLNGKQSGYKLEEGGHGIQVHPFTNFTSEQYKRAFSFFVSPYKKETASFNKESSSEEAILREAFNKIHEEEYSASFFEHSIKNLENFKFFIQRSATDYALDRSILNFDIPILLTASIKAKYLDSADNNYEAGLPTIFRNKVNNLEIIPLTQWKSFMTDKKEFLLSPKYDFLSRIELSKILKLTKQLDYLDLQAIPQKDM